MKEDVDRISILPYNGENFRTITLNNFIFLDSLAFLQSSLSGLSDDLKNSNHDYSILKQSTLCHKKKDDVIDQKKFDAMLAKGIFPYSYW